MENIKFETCAQAYDQLFLTPHKGIMKQRKELKTAIDKAIEDYKKNVATLEAKDKANFEAWKKAQAELKTAREDNKKIEIVAKPVAEKKTNKKSAVKSKDKVVA